LPDSASHQAVDPKGEKHPVHAHLLADQDAVPPGGTFRLGVHLDQRENWHTYWKSPGDIGLPTAIEWGVPDGATTGPVAFPIPQRFDSQGIVSYGYDGAVLFYTEVTVPEGLAPGPTTLTAEANWLVCEVVCIPGGASLSLPFLVAEEGGGPNGFAPLFDHYAAQHPVAPASISEFRIETALSANAVQPGGEFRFALRLSPSGDTPLQFETTHGTWPAFVPIVSDTWMHLDSRVDATEDGGLQVLLSGMAFEVEDLPTGEVVGGLLQVRAGDKTIRTEVTVPLPFVALGEETVSSNSPLLGGAVGGLGAGPTEAAAGAPSEATSTPPADSRSFLAMLGLAFLGGVLLNIMPCVLPVLTLKLYSLVEQSDVGPQERRIAGVAYAVGIILSFLALAGVLIVLRSSLGLGVGWGFQFQYPPYVLTLASVVFLFGLSLFGVFEVPMLGATRVTEASSGEGAVGYLLTGVFATLLATPCSAPFLGTGMGFALGLPSWGILLFFGVAGLGLAAPFLLIAVIPALFRFLPRPGAWMETFKHLMGFTLMATTVWLVDVFMAQTGRSGGTGLLAFLMFIGVGAWVFGRWGGLGAPPRRQLGALGVALAIIFLGGRSFLVLEPVAAVQPTGELATDLDFSEEIPWQGFSEERVEELSDSLVFVDFTADWCLTCKVNEKHVLATRTVREAMDRLGVVPLKADWTRRDEVITAWLLRFGRAGVPFYLVLPPGGADPIPLPEVITPGLVVDALEKGAERG
jgi:thiol:disulfide interchange protein DsbD